MKKLKTISIVVSLFILAAASTSGCSTTEKLTILNAIERTSKITSYESQSVVTMDFGISGLPVELQGAADELLPMMKNIRLQSSQIMNRNAEQTRINSRADITFTSSAMADNMSLWTTVVPGTSGVRQIIRIPAILSSQLPTNLAGKEYMVINSSDLSQLGADNSNIAKAATGLQEKIISFLKDYAIQYDTQFPYVTYKGKTTVKSIPVDIYEIKLTNESLKSLVRHALYDVADNEAAKNAIKDLVYSIIDASGGNDAGKDLDLAFSKFTDGTSTFKQDVDKVRRAFKNVNVLGDKGFVLSMAIDENGYIIDQNGIMDVVIDTAAVDAAVEKLYAGTGKVVGGSAAEMNMVLSSTLTFDSYIYNINKDIAVEYPELNASNSFDFTEMFGEAPSLGTISSAAIKGAFLEGKIEAKPASKLLKSKTVKSELVPVRIKDSLLIPIKPVCKAIGAKVSKDKKGDIILSKGKTKLVLHSGSSQAKLNDKLFEMKLPAVGYEGDLLVPAEFISRNFNCLVNYDKKQGSFTIQY